MDEIDDRIVRELQADARRPNTALAAAAGVSPSTMHGRVRSLEERGVITGYHANIDLAALDRRVEALVSVRLRPKTADAVDAFVESIWARPETMAVTMVTGPYDILIHLSVQDVASLSHTVLTHIASAPNVVDEQTSIVFEHRRKPVLGPLEASSPA